MKTIEQTKLYLIDQLYSMLKHPLMFAPTAESFELQALQLIDLYCFVEDKDMYDQLAGGSWRGWRKFCHKEIGHSGVFSVATFLKNEGRLDEHWTELTTLLERFCGSFSIMGYTLVPVPA